MLRILVTLVVGSAVGWGFGQLQSTVMNRGIEERFEGARSTLAEERGELTAEQLASQTGPSGKVEIVGGTEFNFGVMQHGATMSHDFLLRTIGEGPLNLSMGGAIWTSRFCSLAKRPT